MRLGITPPLFTMTPNGHAPWEVDAAFDEVVPLVEAADRLVESGSVGLLVRYVRGDVP